MDLKILLRYQISGSIFIGWFLLFHYSVHSADFADMATKIMNISSLAALVISIPIGAIIHQFSVTIKNQIFGATCIPILSDSPMKNSTSAILDFYESKTCDSHEKKAKSLDYLNYVKEKITNLNSFYYMRFDNGFLAPLLAYVLFISVEQYDIKYICTAIAISVLLILVVLIVYFLRRFFRVASKIICVMLILASVIGIVKYKDFFIPSIGQQSNIELTTKSIQIESNTRYVITNEYSFESLANMIDESVVLADNSLNINNISSLLGNYNLQKTSIIESNTSTKEESQPHISKTEITKIDTTLLDKILVVCLIISFLLLSYIPRIIQELKEYTEKLSPGIENDKNKKTSKCSGWCLLSGFILACIIWIIYSDRDK